MIDINDIFNLFEKLIHLLFDWINIPAFPESFKDSINTFLDLIFNNLDFLGFFIRPSTLNILVPLIIFIFNFKYIYKFLMWLIRKLPFIRYRLIMQYTLALPKYCILLI